MSKLETSYSTPDVELFRVPLPETTRTYKAVSHRELSDSTLEAIHGAGFLLESQRLTSAREGQVANGRYIISNVADSEMKLEIGWQNSYDKSLSLKFAIGTRIIVCDNGCVGGDLGSFKRKHTGDVVDFSASQIAEEIKKAEVTFLLLQKQRESMKEIEVSERIIAELVGRMFMEQNLIGSTQLNIIKNELKNPTFDYGDVNSLWTLYQHTTFAMREIHPRVYMDDHMKIHNFFVNDGIDAILRPKISGVDRGRPVSLFGDDKSVRHMFENPSQINLLDSIEEIEADI